MRVLDANILLLATNRDAANHAAVRQWLESAYSEEVPIALCWVVLLAFLRVSTHPRIFGTPLSADDAVGQVEAWLRHPNTRLIVETEGHWTVYRELLAEAGMAGNLATDAHLAAISISHGATLVSCDTDFARFKRLRWLNPLTS